MPHHILSRPAPFRVGAVSIVSLLLCTGLASVASAQQRDKPGAIAASALEQIAQLQADKATWTPAERKLDSGLLFAVKRTRGDAFLQQLPDLRTGDNITAADGLIDVEIRGTIGPSLKSAVAQGGRVISSHPEKSRMYARVPLASLLTLAECDDVTRIRRNLGYEVRKDNTSEGDVAHRANSVRTTLGVDGSGVTIGVLSDGIDTLAARQASGDLPPTVNVVSGQSGTGDEGTAMLEIVHDLAPGATLWFATADGGEAQFATNIAALQAAGCNIIVDDVFYFAEATFQDGVIAQAVNDFTDAGGLYFSSAGNSGNLNDGTAGVWEGNFALAATDPTALSGEDTHDFGAGSTNVITVDTSSYFILQWADAIGESANDYDLYLLNPAGTSIFDAGVDIQDGDDDAFEFIDSQGFNDTNNRLAIVKFDGVSRFLWLNSNRGELAQVTTGQTSGHATARDAFGVAATDWFFAAGTNGTGVPFDGTEDVETFSSDGPRRMFYEADGTPYTPGNFTSTGGVVRNQPKITGADGVTTAAPGFDPFFGTSAAAPHVAAIAALILENADLTPAGFEQLLSMTSLDIETVGYDRDSGYGIASAFSAVNTTFPSGIIGATPSCVVTNLTLTGDPNAGAQTFRACTSITAGDGQFDDLTLIAYNSGTSTPGTIILQNGFATAGPLVLRTTAP
jgi:hypothetical protein